MWSECNPSIVCSDRNFDECTGPTYTCVEPLLGNCSGCWPDWCVDQCGLSTCASNGYCGSYDSCSEASPQGYECKFCDGSTVGATPGPTAIPGNTNTPTNTKIPTPSPGVATVNVRARIAPNSATTCADVDNASTDWLSVGLNLRDAISNLTPIGQTAAGGAYASWSVGTPGYYSISDTAPAGYALSLGCSTVGDSITGITAGTPGQTINWELWYKTGMGWYQAQGGDVYGANTIKSFVPQGPRYFVLNGDGGSPGVVTFGNTYDFDSAAGIADIGSGWISSENWNANETYDEKNYYQIMFHRFHSPVTADYTGDTTLNTQLAGREAAYYVDGNLIIDGSNWNVASVTPKESVVVLVNGNLTIKNRINITSGGFIGFFVNGNITIDSSVGTTWSSTTPVVEGIYMTSPTGTFSTGATTAAATARFVGKGTFVAGNFSLLGQRDLEIVGHNADTAAELFIYNPELLITMPDEMKELPITWAEVAP